MIIFVELKPVIIEEESRYFAELWGYVQIVQQATPVKSLHRAEGATQRDSCGRGQRSRTAAQDPFPAAPARRGCAGRVGGRGGGGWAAETGRPAAAASTRAEPGSMHRLPGPVSRPIRVPSYLPVHPWRAAGGPAARGVSISSAGSKEINRFVPGVGGWVAAPGLRACLG